GSAAGERAPMQPCAGLRPPRGAAATRPREEAGRRGYARVRLPRVGDVARAAGLGDVILVVVLGRPERPGRLDLRDDLALPVAPGLAQLVDVRLGLALLGGAGGPDAGAVLLADVGALAVALRGVVHLEERFQQAAIADLARVVHDLHGLGVAGVVVADLLVGRPFGAALHVPADRVDHARALLEIVLHAPEAARREVGGLGLGFGGRL